MARGIFILTLGLITAVACFYGLCKVFKKNRKIDTESIAIVTSVQSLGRDDGQKVYAVRYDIKSSNPFELLVTPVRRPPEIGKQRAIFYEKDNPKNHFFKTIGHLDNRFIMPLGTFACGVGCMIIGLKIILAI